jgi:hypothetical protein
MSNEIAGSTRPRKKPDVAEKIGKGALIFDMTAGHLHELNEVGKIVWSLCDGKHTVDDMVKTIREQYDTSDVNIAEDLASFLKRLVELNLIAS